MSRTHNSEITLRPTAAAPAARRLKSLQEARAVVWDSVDFGAGTVEIQGTVIRDENGLRIQPRPQLCSMSSGLTVREIADQLDHAQTSVTQDT
jgi:hypothetical protein